MDSGLDSFSQKFKTIKRLLKNYLLFKSGYPNPFFCSFFTTFKCNLKCIYCPIGRYTGSSFSDYTKVTDYEMNTVEALYSIDWMSKMGVTVISFTGGEPLLRNDIMELSSYARDKGIITILNTNGTLIDEKNAYIISKNFNMITISLSGCREIDDRLRGAGTWDKTMQGIYLLKRNSDVKVNINFVINKLNYKYIDDIVELTINQNVDSITFLPVGYELEFLLDDSAAERVQDKLKYLKRKYKYFINNSWNTIGSFKELITGRNLFFECDSFFLYFSLMPDGRINGCCGYPCSFGNIQSQSIREYRIKARKRKEELRKSCRGGCSSVLYREMSFLFNQPLYKNLLRINKFMNFLKILRSK